MNETTLILLITLCSVTFSLPLTEERSSIQNTIINYENENDGSGNYRFSFETSDGTRRIETGTLINQGQPNEYIAVTGFYSYIRPDGEYEEINYTADLNGYKILKKDDITQVVNALPDSVVASLLGK